MMEVDLLNAGGKELGDLAEEESSGRCDDAEFSVGSTVLWPLLDNASPLQHFMPFKTQQEQKFKNFLFNLIPATEFQHISQKAHIVLASRVPKPRHEYKPPAFGIRCFKKHPFTRI
ncbi:uncharacterized protein LOC110027205 isoform X2 [Phalaenopsis equestris]|uniref:uncharacterized protein LOC110027205 isoform X2 n=1 Tax=Phalaenopsis equestris TaxID=78828 RepID=UPI0009E3422F|nr:uncharacterized protein LOC110027205 isoform X2 [Phalaenopsis equestris]